MRLYSPEDVALEHTMNHFLSLLSRYRWFRPVYSRQSLSRPRAGRRTLSRLTVESLERRDVPSTLSVNSVTVTEGNPHFGSLGGLVDQAANGGLDRSSGMTFGPDGNLYMGSQATNEVLRYSATTGAFLGAFVTSGSGGLSTPAVEGLCFRPDGKLYVASRDNSDVLRFDATTGAFIDTFIPSNSGGLQSVKGMVFGPDGNLYLSSSATNQVLRYSGTTGAFLGVFVAAGSGGLTNPRYLAFGPDGNLDVSSNDTNSVLRYNGTTGEFLNALIAPNSGGLDFPGEFQFANGKMYVASQNTNQVLCYDAATGAFIEAAAAANSDGLDRPIGLLLDANSNLLVGSYAEILRFGPASQAAFTVTLSSASSSPVTVNYSTADGSAAAGSDYVTASGTVTFAPGETTRTVLVKTIDDSVTEPTETFTVNLTNPSGATIANGQGVGTILDDESARQISIGDASAIEGTSTLKLLDRFVAAGSGGLMKPRGLVFGPDANSDGVKDLYIADRNLSAILRYDGVTGAYIDTFVPTGSGGLNEPGDLVFGPDGDLYVSSQAGNQVLKYDASGGFLGVVATGLSTPIGITFGSDGNLYIANFGTNEVLRSNNSILSVFVSSGSGVLNGINDIQFGPDGNLYVQSANGVLRYDGQTGAFINTFAGTVPGQGGGLWLGFGTDGYLYTTSRTTPSTLATSLNRFNATTGTYVDTFSIGRDSWNFMIGPSNIIYYSGNGGANYVERYGPSALAAFTVSLDSASSTKVTVNYSTSDGTALAGGDYVVASGTITFSPGQTSRTILVQTIDDTVSELTESFFVNLSNPVGATIADRAGTGTILDNDLQASAITSANNATFAVVPAARLR